MQLRTDPRDPAAADGEAAELSAVERTLRLLRRGIETGAYAPGQRLVEPDLTDALNVSRSSLREALSRLSAEGIVEIVPNRGAAVRRFSERDVRNIQQIRIALEPLAASLAATTINEPGNRTRLEEVAAGWLSEQPPVQDVDLFARENRRFHQAIVEMSGNEQLATIIERLNMSLFAAQFRQRITLEIRKKSAAEHRQIALAIRAGDGHAARRAMEAHVQDSSKIIFRDGVHAFDGGS